MPISDEQVGELYDTGRRSASTGNCSRSWTPTRVRRPNLAPRFVQLQRVGVDANCRQCCRLLQFRDDNGIAHLSHQSCDSRACSTKKARWIHVKNLDIIRFLAR